MRNSNINFLGSFVKPKRFNDTIEGVTIYSESKDSEGYLFIVGRKDHQLKIGGFRLNVQEVEELINRNNYVHEVAVVPFIKSGQQNIAAFVTSPGLQATEWKKAQRSIIQELPNYMRPTEIFFFDQLPRGVTGKIDREALKNHIKKGCHE